MNINENFVLRKIYGKSILIPVRKNEVGNEPIYLNGTGSVIWDLVYEGLSREEILAYFSNEYELKADSTEKMIINNFIDEMVEMKLIYE